ncbi:MAG: 4-hydroxythreonine-4-phosphate dehydrogenase PdxA, partial [Acholeplasmataceae bacterium]
KDLITNRDKLVKMIKDYRNFDVIVGMYHDQVLPTFKSIFKFDAINLTLGLKYLRVSPDHGVASNIIKKNKQYMLVFNDLIVCFRFD